MTKTRLISSSLLQPFLERRGDWTYCALAIRHLCQDDAGNYSVQVTNKYGEKTNHVRLSMKDPNEPQKYANPPRKRRFDARITV